MATPRGYHSGVVYEDPYRRHKYWLVTPDYPLPDSTVLGVFSTKVVPRHYDGKTFLYSPAP